MHLLFFYAGKKHIKWTHHYEKKKKKTKEIGRYQNTYFRYFHKVMPMKIQKKKVDFVRCRRLRCGLKQSPSLHLAQSHRLRRRKDLEAQLWLHCLRSRFEMLSSQPHLLLKFHRFFDNSLKHFLKSVRNFKALWMFGSIPRFEVLWPIEELLKYFLQWMKLVQGHCHIYSAAWASDIKWIYYWLIYDQPVIH